jgi:hypothetical protein
MGLFPAGDLGLKIGKATWVEISRAFHDRPTRFFAIPEIKHALPPSFCQLILKQSLKKAIRTLDTSLFILGEQGSLFHVELKSSPFWVK